MPDKTSKAKKEPNRNGTHIVGVDIGGTNVRAALFDLDGTKLAEARNDTLAPRGPRTVAKQVSETIAKCLDKGNAAGASVAGIGCGMPGRITADGVVLWSPNFPSIEGVPLADWIAKPLGLPLWMENDVNVAALGEFEFGAAKDVNSLVMLPLGTGIGGGIILDRRLWSGFNAGGAEIGHHVVNPGGRKCGCGNHGCLEAMAQRDAIIERAALKIQTGRPSLLAQKVDSQVDAITPALIADCAHEGDEICIETFAETGFWIGVGIANMINILNPEMVIIGGGISEAGDVLWRPMLRTVKAYAIHESRLVCQVVPAKLGDDAGVMGGFTLVRRTLEAGG